MNDASAGQYVIGRRAVLEALNAGAELDKIFIAYGAEETGPLTDIRTAAKAHGVHCAVMDRRKFSTLEGTLGVARNDAQGVIALRPAQSSISLDDLFDVTLAISPAPFLVALDGITDPHNFGAIARSAECAGVMGLILPVKYTASVTPAAVKASAGALEHMRMARVPRVSEALTAAKQRGFRVIGTTIPGTNVYTDDVYQGPIIIVIGSEGEGIHPSVAAKCDALVTIPMAGKVGSLNASVASGIVFFEALRQRS